MKMSTTAASTMTAGALLALTAITGCSSTAPTTTPVTTATAGTTSSAGSTIGPHNEADVAFATDMIPHHAQAVQMANSAPSRAASPVVKSLAQQIKKAQDPEIITMSGWLRSWGQPVPAASTGTMHMGAGTGARMMSAADMAGLDKATGPAYDRMWVTLMIRHHQGAVTMATTERTHGTNAGAKRLAAQIITSQNAEITRMRTLLKQLPAN